MRQLKGHMLIPVFDYLLLCHRHAQDERSVHHLPVYFLGEIILAILSRILKVYMGPILLKMLKYSHVMGCLSCFLQAHF
jgi:hypothetical protein